MQDEKNAWNEKYKSHSHTSLEADPFLVEGYRSFVSPLFPVKGTALDVAGGVGRHSIFLARDGWQVTLMDISGVGIKQAGINAEQAGVKIRLVTQDLARNKTIPARFDLILVFFFLEREFFPHLWQALKPRGLLLYKTYTQQSPKSKSGGPSHPMYLLKETELLNAFSQAEILHYSEPPGKGTAELIARKPAV